MIVLDLLVTLALGVAALACLVLLIGLVMRYPLIGLAALGLVTLSLWEIPVQTALAGVSGFSIYPNDLAAIVFATIAVLRWQKIRDHLGTSLFLSWLGFGVLIALSLVTGIAQFDTGQVVVDARLFVLFFGATSWVFTLAPGEIDLRRFSLILGWGLVIVALYHMALHGLGGAGSRIMIDGIERTGRPLVAGQAMALSLCAGWVFFGAPDSRRRSDSWSAALFFLVVILAQHRSVWAASIGAMAVVLIAGTRRPARLRVFGLALVGLWAASVVWFSGALGPIGEQLRESLEDRDTFDARTSSWAQLIPQSFEMGPFAVLFGQPFGSGYERLEGWTREASYSPHNWYVSLFLRVGVLGLVLWVAMMLRGFARARRDGRATALFVICALAIFGWSYSLAWYFAPWLGAALQYAAAARTQPSTRRTLPAKRSSRRLSQ